VLPVAIAAAVAQDTSVVLLASNAPSQTPGHTRFPSSNTATNAIPEAGHTAEAFPGEIAKANPIMATAKYAAVSRITWIG
jgi:hypothetical protein